MKKTGDWKDLFVMGMGGFNGGHNILCDKCASILIGIKTYTIANRERLNMISSHEGGGGGGVLKKMGKSVIKCDKKFGGRGRGPLKSDITLFFLKYMNKNAIF